LKPVQRALTIVAAALSVALVACASPEAAAPAATATVASNPTPIAMKAVVANATATSAAPATTTAPAATATAANTASTAASIRYDVVADGTTADYRVREQLVRLTAPSDAVGKTNKVTGSLVLGSDGKVDASQSKFTVDLTTLASDSAMRDGFIGRSTLDLSSYPNAVFVPTALEGLPSPLPTLGSQSFQMIGNMTLHGVTKPATWKVTSAVSGNDLTGTATTSFKFEDYGMTPPKSGAILSVVDNVTLELTFHLAKSA
jgi:polyisoprenoid-binding protein YceI